MRRFSEEIRSAVWSAADELLALSHSIHAEPELSFAEHRSAEKVAHLLAAKGFNVIDGIGDLPTAFDAHFGNGSLHVACVAEYDALPDIGHACGHNIIAAAAVGAGVALRSLADELDLTVHVIGAPAEESGGGKQLLIERGVFDSMSAALMVHPGPHNIVAPFSRAMSEIAVTFDGRASHASSAPELGINASDAATIGQVAIGLLRQHFSQHQQVHGIVTNGGSAPNIVPHRNELLYNLRAATDESLEDLTRRLQACWEGAALATGCGAHVTALPPMYAELVASPTLQYAAEAEFRTLGRQCRPASISEPLGSTDMGNVSKYIPSIHPMISLDTDARLHQVEFAAASVSSGGDRAVIDGARLIAGCVARVLSDAELRTSLAAEVNVLQSRRTMAGGD